MSKTLGPNSFQDITFDPKHYITIGTCMNLYILLITFNQK